MQVAFNEPVEVCGGVLTGAWRTPRRALGVRRSDGYDDATAQRLGSLRGALEGPTHLGQFAPLCVAAWSPRWFESGCISAHYRSVSFGDPVRALMSAPRGGTTHSTIWMERDDGTEILRGTASLGRHNPPSELEQRMRRLERLRRAVFLRDVWVGMKTQRQIVRTSMDQQLGKAHPLSLLDRLGATVEFSPWYTTQGALQSPWSRPIIPIDMISVLLNHAKGAQPFPIRGPSVAVFADQEIRLNQGPLFVGDSYEVEREVVAVSGSRRTENMWVCTRVYARGADALLATMLVNFEIIDASHLHYERQRRL